MKAKCATKVEIRQTAPICTFIEHCSCMRCEPMPLGPKRKHFSQRSSVRAFRRMPTWRNKQKMAAQVHGFQTEVAKLLKLLANSLYSNKEVFLRELISNASDAIDKLRFLSITKPELAQEDPVLRIRVRADRDAGTLTISDNGIGMTLAEANERLGTIANSGTEDFLSKLSADDAKSSQLIGQFGVGFYSAFIVADRVTVRSRAAGAKPDEAVCWSSDGTGTYMSETTVKADRGTDVILHLKADEREFLNDWTLRETITKFSDHISTPVYLYEAPKDDEKKEDDKKEASSPEDVWHQVNDAKALWTLSPKDVKDEEYKAFYTHLTHDYGEPLAWAHNRVEGDLEYTSLLYIPGEAPWDLYGNPEEQKGLKLFVQRVFIMDRAKAFLPNYLRFIRGLVDTNDLPLNVSRELLQESRVVSKLKKALTKRSLDMIEKLAEDKENVEKYRTFWSAFGRVLKEGVVEDPANRERILKCLRFASTKTIEEGDAALVSLDEYIARAPEAQKKIYFLIAGTREAAEHSPYLETLKKKNVEVLLLWDRIDEWMMNAITEYAGKGFVSATASDLELGDLADKEEEKAREEETKEAQADIERLKKALGDKVEGVRVSTRLVDSPSCVVGSNDQMLTAQMRRMLEAAGQPVPEEKFTLEINPKHPLITKALAETDEKRFADWAAVILEEAHLADQGTLKDPAGFVKRLNALLLG